METKNYLEYDKNRKNNGEVIGERFEFENVKCDCLVDRIHENGIPHYQLQIKADNTKKIYYAYDSQKRGLVITDSECKEILSEKNKSDVLTELCNLKWDGENGPSQLVDFIKQHGFFFLIQTQNYWICDFDELCEVLKHLQNMIGLLHELHFKSEEINYNRLFNLTFYYIFSDGHPLTLRDCSDENNDCKINRCVHPYGELWWNPDLQLAEKMFYLIRKEIDDLVDPIKDSEEYESIMDEMEDEERRKKICENYYYPIHDKILDQDVNLNGPSWLRYIEGKKPINPYENQKDSKEIEWEMGLHYYTTFLKDDAEIRLVAEFLYNFNEKVVPITKISPNGVIEFEQEINLNNSQAFDGRYKNALIQIARSVYKRELNWALQDIRPVCDAENLRPKWNIPSFLTALYFSLFYFDSEYQEYRICENETCRKWFSVPKSRRNKKYCSPKCANLAAQRRFQMKQIK